MIYGIRHDGEKGYPRFYPPSFRPQSATEPWTLNQIPSALVSYFARTEHALARLEVAGEMVPSLDWSIYAFVRKEAVSKQPKLPSRTYMRSATTSTRSNMQERRSRALAGCRF